MQVSTKKNLQVSTKRYMYYTFHGKQVKGSDSNEFLLSNKECVVNAEVFRKILDICPRKKGKDFIKVPNDDDTLTLLIGLGYSGPLHKYTNIENVDYPSLIWEDIAYQIDHRQEKKSRRENMPYPRFTKVIIDYFLFKIKSLKKLKFQHLHTIKDDGVVSRLKFVRIGEAVQQYGLPIHATMLNIDIIKSESYQRVTKKETTISAADNIIPIPDLALELDNSISLTKAEKEAVAREVNATHEKIVSEAILEPTRRRQTGVTIRDTSSILKKKTLDPSKKLKGVLTLTPAEQEAGDIMEALKESRKTSRRQSGTGGSDEGTGEIPRVPDESTVVFAISSERTDTKPGVPDKEEIIHKEGADETRENSDRDADAEDDDEEIESDSKDIYKYKIKVRKDADVEMKDAKTIKEKEDLSVSFDYGTQFLNLSQDEETFKKPPVTSTTSELQQTTPIPTTIPTTPINTKAPSIPEITPLIAVSLRVTKLEQDVSKLKKTDHFAALASIQSQVHTIIDKYLALKEFDLKSALFKATHENKSANRNPTNYRLYHALMEALIEDENAMDKDVANTGKTSKMKRTRDSESAKKPSTTNENFKGKAPKKDSKTGKSAPSEEPVEKPTKEVSMDEKPTEDIPSPDDMHVLDLEDTDNAHIPKVDLVNPEGHRIVPDISKPFPLGGPSGQYDISAPYGITHWWFRRKELHINNHRVSSDRHIVRSHMRILSVISIKSYERYDYNYLNEIVLLRADYNEYKILENDFKNIHPNDFEDLKILHLQKHLSDANEFTMKMKILLEPSSNKLLVGSYKDEVGDTLYQ
nr:hypothetical protein [Tanacetum cinerariifolium]